MAIELRFEFKRGNVNMIQSRMVYASSRETLKNALNGIAMNWQANDPGELEWADLLKEASKGKGTI
jgi:hypothetical protein